MTERKPKRPVGRPPLPAHQRRRNTIMVRLTDHAFMQLEAAAKRGGQPRSDFARAAIEHASKTALAD